MAGLKPTTVCIIWMALYIEKEIEENKDDGTGGHQQKPTTVGFF